MTANEAVRDEPEARSGTGCLAVVLLLVALAWSGITVTFDTIVGRDALNQWRAKSYLTTSGTVVVSHVEEDDEGAHPEIRYRYRVAGKEYEGNRFRYELRWNNGGNARRTVDEYPSLSKSLVHYDAKNPSDAVLEVGLDGRNLFLLMATLPFNLVLVSLWVWFGYALYSRERPPVAGGAKVLDDGTYTRVRLSEWPPIVTAGGVAFGLSFVSIFLVGIPSNFDPPPVVMPVVFAVIFGGALLAFLLRRRMLARDDCDLVIDNPGRSLALPRAISGTADLLVRFENVLSVEVETIERRDAQGYLKHSCFVPTLCYADRDGSTRRIKLAEWSDKHRAEELTAWLRKQLGVGRPASDLR